MKHVGIGPRRQTKTMRRVCAKASGEKGRRGGPQVWAPWLGKRTPADLASGARLESERVEPDPPCPIPCRAVDSGIGGRGQSERAGRANSHPLGDIRVTRSFGEALDRTFRRLWSL